MEQNQPKSDFKLIFLERNMKIQNYGLLNYLAESRASHITIKIIKAMNESQNVVTTDLSGSIKG